MMKGRKPGPAASALGLTLRIEFFSKVAPNIMQVRQEFSAFQVSGPDETR